jgi:hypothetical protein
VISMETRIGKQPPRYGKVLIWSFVSCSSNSENGTWQFYIIGQCRVIMESAERGTDELGWERIDGIQITRRNDDGFYFISHGPHYKNSPVYFACFHKQRKRLFVGNGCFWGNILCPRLQPQRPGLLLFTSTSPGPIPPVITLTSSPMRNIFGICILVHPKPLIPVFVTKKHISIALQFYRVIVYQPLSPIQFDDQPYNIKASKSVIVSLMTA